MKITVASSSHVWGPFRPADSATVPKWRINLELNCFLNFFDKWLSFLKKLLIRVTLYFQYSWNGGEYWKSNQKLNTGPLPLRGKKLTATSTSSLIFQQTGLRFDKILINSSACLRIQRHNPKMSLSERNTLFLAYSIHFYEAQDQRQTDGSLIHFCTFWWETHFFDSVACIALKT